MFVSHRVSYTQINKAAGKVSRQARAQRNKLWRLGSRLGTSIQVSMTKGLKAFKSRTSVEALMGAIATQDFGKIIQTIPFELLKDDLVDMGERLEDGAMIGAKFAAENFPSIVQGEIDFSAANPKVKRWIDSHVGELIVQVDSDARESVKGIVTRAFNRGLPPLESAKLVRNVVPLSGRYAVALDNHRAGLVEQGLSATKVDQLSNEYADRLLTSRAESIARTETANALNQGQQLLWEQAADEGLIDPKEAKRQWVIDPVTAKGCPVCEPMDGQVVGLYEPFTTGLGDEVYAPSAHPNCNCLVNLIL